MPKQGTVQRLEKALKRGALRSKELQERGFSRDQIRRAVSSGAIVHLSRGLYANSEYDFSEHLDLVNVSKRVPNARICLISALAFHELTTQIPHGVWIAIGQKDRRPSISYPPIYVQHFSGAALTEGLETHVVDGTRIRVYSVAKTIVDLFRFRNKVGIDIALEALREGWRYKRFRMDEIDDLAKKCRMSRVMTPYLESLIA